MKLTLHTEVDLDSCHKLEGYKGKCAELHGHTWKVEIWFKGDSKHKDEVGIMVDFGIVKDLKEILDHKYINDVVHMNPTAENLTEWIYKYIVDKIDNHHAAEPDDERVQVKVRVYETAVTKVTWCEAGDFE